jgi:hypothetical protein
MGAISSINFKKSNAIQTRHNDRDLPPNYLISDTGCEVNRTHKEALKLRNKIIENAINAYNKNKSPKAPNFKAKSYEWSAVVNIKQDTTMQDLENLAKHFEHINLSLYEDNSLEPPQKIQFGSYFFKMIEEPSTNISIGSFTFISNLFLNSIGITTLPNSSTFLTIPVAFILYPPKRNIIMSISVNIFRQIIPLHDNTIFCIFSQ